MRLSTIAVCLLLVSPPSVLACFEHTPEQTGWFQEVPSSSGEAAWMGVQAMWWDRTPGLWMFGAGSASVALVLVSFRAFTRAAGPGSMQLIRPAENPTRIANRRDSGFKIANSNICVRQTAIESRSVTGAFLQGRPIFRSKSRQGKTPEEKPSHGRYDDADQAGRGDPQRSLAGVEVHPLQCGVDRELPGVTHVAVGHERQPGDEGGDPAPRSTELHRDGSRNGRMPAPVKRKRRPRLERVVAAWSFAPIAIDSPNASMNQVQAAMTSDRDEIAEGMDGPRAQADGPEGQQRRQDRPHPPEGGQHLAPQDVARRQRRGDQAIPGGSGPLADDRLRPRSPRRRARP